MYIYIHTHTRKLKLSWESVNFYAQKLFLEYCFSRL